MPLQTPAPSALGTPDATHEPTPTPEPFLWPNTVVKDATVIKQGDSHDGIILIQQRLRALGYFNYKITGEFGNVTKLAIMAFQRENGLEDDGAIGVKTNELLFSNMARRGFGARGRPTPTPKPRVTPTPKKDTSAPKYGTLIEWSRAQSLVRPGETFTIIDYSTRISWKERRLGGDNHLDSEPLTKADTAKLKQVYGGRFSWSRRAVLIKVGSKYYAASINGYPHSPYRIKDNNYPGHHCVHFYKSRTHGSNSSDPDHQRMVKRAAGQ